MSVRKFGEKTQHDYIRRVESAAKFLLAFLSRWPDTASAVDPRRYQVQQTAKQSAAAEREQSGGVRRLLGIAYATKCSS